jgi:hypothetical protein
MSQFAAKQVSSLSAAAVSSVKSQQRRSVLFIRNGAGIVVGQVIADGVKVDRDPQGLTGRLDVCLTFPTEFQSEIAVAEYRWAAPNEDFTEFILFDASVNLGDVTCFSLVNSTQVYFPVGLQQSWQNATFSSTLFPGEIFFLAMGMVWYFAILVFTAYHFVLHIMLRVPDVPFFNLSTTALFISLIFLLNRFIYMVLILSGAMDQNPQVEVVFSSFPALLFYVIYSIIVIRWAEIYHFTMTAGAKRGISRLRPAIIALNVFLVVAFVLLIILFFALQDYSPVIYSCATPEDQLTEKSIGDIVSIVYKAFFAAVSAVLSALFVIYGIRVLLLMRSATKRSTKTVDQKRSRENAFHRLMAVSAVCTIALLAQAVFLLWSSVTATNQDEGRFYGILTFLYLTEMPPAIIFVVMFKKASAFVKGSKNSMTTRNTLSQTGDHSVPMGSTAEETDEQN